MLANRKHIWHPSFAVFSAIVSRLGLLVWLIVVARLLQPNDFGAFVAFLVIAGMVNAIVSGGGDMWLNGFTSGGSVARLRAPRIWAVYLVCCCLLAVAVLGISLPVLLAEGSVNVSLGYLDAYASAGAILIAGAAVAGLAEACFALIRASHRVKRFFALRDIAAPVILVAATLIARPETAAQTSIVYLAVWSAVCLGAVLVLVLTPGLLPPVNYARPAVWRRVALHTAGMIYSNFSSRLATYIDVLALVYIVNLPTLGEYRMAAHLAVGFMVAQHFVFLTLTWQLRRSAIVRGAGSHGDVMARQRFLLGLSAVAVAALLPLAPTVMSLMGERFVGAAHVLQVYALLRFLILFWGPNHEILVSNGRTIQDANANMLSVACWSITFVVLYGAGFPPIPSAVVGAVLAANLGQLIRVRMIRAAGLEILPGHRFGFALPAACSLGLMAIAAVALLP